MVGVSADPIDVLERYVGDLALPFPLVSDPDLVIGKAFGVAGENGLEKRSCFIVDPKATIRYSWADQPGLPDPEQVLEALSKVSGA